MRMRFSEMEAEAAYSKSYRYRDLSSGCFAYSAMRCFVSTHLEMSTGQGMSLQDSYKMPLSFLVFLFVRQRKRPAVQRIVI